MAIELAIETPSGAVANYHRVIIAEFGTGLVSVQCYLDEAARNAGKAMLMGTNYCFPDAFTPESLSPEGATPWGVAYGLVKTTDTFVGAKDLL